MPLLVNLQPAGEYLGEDYYRAGGVPAVVGELMSAGPDPRGRADRQRQDASATIAAAPTIEDERVIRPFDQPLQADAGFLVLRGNLFDSAIMKTSVISDEFRARYLSNPDDPEAFEGPVVVFDGPEDYHAPDRRSRARHRRPTPCWSCAAPGRSAIPARPKS